MRKIGGQQTGKKNTVGGPFRRQEQNKPPRTNMKVPEATRKKHVLGCSPVEKKKLGKMRTPTKKKKKGRA